jgi:hypothetical protein
MSDNKNNEDNWLDEPSGEEYRLVEVPTNHHIEKASSESISKATYEPLQKPKKVRVINAWDIIKLPFSFVSLVLAFWIALNLTSIVEEGDLSNWFKNWASNTQDSIEGYFGSGQVATYDGIFENKADWVGNSSAGEPTQILESEFFPFGESKEFPLVIERINAAFEAEQCVVLYSEYLTYKAIVDAPVSENPGYPIGSADVMMTYALDKYKDLECVREEGTDEGENKPSKSPSNGEDSLTNEPAVDQRSN